MRILRVFGEDYSALRFEGSTYTVEQIFRIYDDGDDKELESIKNEIDCDFEFYEVGEICPRFLEFVRCNVQDYDISKSDNFYILGLEENVPDLEDDEE